MFRLEFPDREWKKVVIGLADVSKKSVRSVLKSTARQVVEDCMMRTPPIPKGSFNAGLVAKRKTGEGAVSHDIHKVFKSPQSLKIVRDRRKKNTLGASIRKYAEAGNPTKVNGLLRYIGFNNEQAINAASETLHDRQRNAKTGRVVKRPKVYLVLQKGTIKAYVKKKQKNVFKGMSGWNQAGRALHCRASYWPAQAKKHHEPGWYRESNTKSPDVFFEFGNQSAYMQRLGVELKIVDKAMEFRLRQMKKDLEFKLAYDLNHAK